MTELHVFTPLEREIAAALKAADLTTDAVTERAEGGAGNSAIADHLGRTLGRQEMRAINRLFNADVITDTDASGQHWIGGLFLTVKGLESLKHPDPPRITSAQRRILEPYADGGQRLADALLVWSHRTARLRVIPMIAKLVELGLLVRKGRADFLGVDITTLGRLAVAKRAHK